jgi:uncharacterized membrane-anchored protein
MRHIIPITSAVALALLVVVPSYAQSAAAPASATGAAAAEVAAAEANARRFDALPFVKAPAKPAVTTRATISLAPGIEYLDAKATNEFLKLTNNLPSDDAYIILNKEKSWWAIYTFADLGYVKDNEKIDADALLKTLKDSDAEANEARKAEGLEPLTTVGWAVPPHYDPTSHNLEYGLTLSTASGSNINYSMRILGRRGVMDATLITSAETLQADLADFRAANKGFAFNTEESYGAFKDGDKVSEYGLAALVTGGVAAAALKGGLFKGLLIFLAKFWKLIAVAVVAAGAGIKRVLFGNRSNDLVEAPRPEEIEKKSDEV